MSWGLWPLAEARRDDWRPAPALGDRDFAEYQAYIYRQAGIHLGPGKKSLVQTRLQKRLRELQLDSHAAYLNLVRVDEAEAVRLLDAITTNETRFFREPAHFQLIEQSVVPAYKAAAAAGRRPRKIRAWSAGCASGEEPYSLAMTLLAGLPAADGWQIEVVATDLSTRALARAHRAVWPIDRASDIPEHYRKAFMLRGVGDQEGWMKAGPELREVVRTARLNLHQRPYQLAGQFDLILCRNVMIYFDAESRRQAVDGMLDHLARDGYFFVGHAESMGRVTTRLRSESPMAYRLAGARERGR